MHTYLPPLMWLPTRRRPYSLKLKEEHIRKMTEIFEELVVIGDPVKVEDSVVHLLQAYPTFLSEIVIFWRKKIPLVARSLDPRRIQLLTRPRDCWLTIMMSIMGAINAKMVPCFVDNQHLRQGYTIRRALCASTVIQPHQCCKGSWKWKGHRVWWQWLPDCWARDKIGCESD